MYQEKGTYIGGDVPYGYIYSDIQSLTKKKIWKFENPIQVLSEDNDLRQ